jgi:hypothetical protein
MVFPPESCLIVHRRLINFTTLQCVEFLAAFPCKLSKLASRSWDTGTTLTEKFGASVIGAVHVRHLLHMTSGLPDYDGEDYARDQFNHRSKDYSPVRFPLACVRLVFGVQPH